MEPALITGVHVMTTPLMAVFARRGADEEKVQLISPLLMVT